MAKLSCARAFAGMIGLFLTAGCATPDLRLVSKPTMEFGEARGYMTALRLGPQHEPSKMTVGGAQASVCAYCK